MAAAWGNRLSLRRVTLGVKRCRPQIKFSNLSLAPWEQPGFGYEISGTYHHKFFLAALFSEQMEMSVLGVQPLGVALIYYIVVVSTTT